MKAKRGRPSKGGLKKSNTGRKNEHLTNNQKFPTDQIRAALFHVQDAMERSQIQFLLLDEVAYQMAHGEDPELEASEVSVGIMMQDFTRSGSSTLRSILPQADWTDLRHGQELLNLSYAHGSVPVVIWFIHNHLDVFNRPDVRFYYNTEFRIPNPFDLYWRKRDLIR